MKEFALFLGQLKNGDLMTGVYLGIHTFGIDWLFMLSFDLSQFAMFRMQILDRGLFQSHGQIVVFELNVLGIIISWRYTISAYDPEDE